jgi:hypothetical protein
MKLRGTAAALFAVAAVVLIPDLLFAHHSSAAYDIGNKITLKGTVKEWVYSNPHCFLILEVKNDAGEVVDWTNETQAPSVIFPVGYRRDSFKFGDHVTITVEPFKDGRPFGRILGAVLADGKVLGPALSPPPNTAPQP